MTEWFERWFGEEYLALYPHRDESDAERIVGLIARHIDLDSRRVLDLACGAGRHAEPFVRRGAAVAGLDLSLTLLRRAGAQRSMNGRVVRGDKRQLPFRAGVFDLVVNLFTSFGYFAEDSEHALVLQQAARALRTGGHFVLDFLNASQVVDTLVAHEELKLSGHRAVVERRISDDGRYVIKQITLPDDGRRFEERVRLFTPEELQRMLRTTELAVSHTFGDYDGGPLERDAPRAIFMAVRPA